MKNISRVLIANRGEIAVRIIKACKELGIESVVVVSEADRQGLPAKLADRAVCIGPPHPRESYLKTEAIISAALGTKSDAIHPGYGFLSERPELAKACQEYGLEFVGPQAGHIEQMGNKLLARQIVQECEVPVVPGSEKVSSYQEALEVVQRVGFPVLLKAAAGGGGRGMRIASEPDELKAAFDLAAGEANAAFGDATLYIERYIPNARHIEVQIIADRFGNTVHLGERDCSSQRRYQKVIEEAPAPSLSMDLRQSICQAAVKIAQNIGYENAGTVEFIFDQDNQKYYFLEMNTRIQVEHPVTEMITGVDLVKEQIRVAANNPLSFSQSDIKFSGHAVECRINAESTRKGFMPCPGQIFGWRQPEGPQVRVDTYCKQGSTVLPYYDSLIAKLIVKGGSRKEAIDTMADALETFTINGIETNIPFLKFLIGQDDFVNEKMNTRWVEKMLTQF